MAQPQGVVSGRRRGTVRAGDIVEVYIAGEPQFSGRFPVSSEGNIKLPQLGVIKAAGLSTARLEAVIAQKAKKYVVDPTVVVAVVGGAPALVHILGEVPQPGAYDIDQASTLLGLLAVAGGVAPTGDASQITIVRRGRQQRVLPKAAPGTDVIPPDVPLQDGDTIIVPRRSVGIVTVTGAVQMPGHIPIEQAGTCTRAFILAGGSATGADLSRAYVLHGSERIDVNLLGLLTGAADAGEDVALSDKDVLVIPLASGRGLGAPETVIIVGAVATPGAMPLLQARSASAAVLMAGGIVPGGDSGSVYVLRANRRIDVDLRAILRGDTEADTLLEPNDLLVVPMLPLDNIYVVGAVASPGAQTIGMASTVAKAVALAGGPAPTADSEATYILRGREQVRVNLRDLLSGKMVADVALEPNDLVVVPVKTADKALADQLAMAVAVAGAVVQPGLVALSQAGTVTRAVMTAGGPTPMADLKHAYILREGQRHSVDAESALNGQGRDAPLYAYDMLVIPHASLNPVYIVGAVVQPGPQSAQTASTAQKAVLMAGGFAPTADPARTLLLRREHRSRVDMEAVMAGRLDDFALAGGDVLLVPDKMSEVIYVAGAVATPGPQTRNWSHSLTRALSLAGVQPGGDLSGAYILRGFERLDVDADRVLRGADDDVALEANDLVIVPMQTSAEQMAAHAAKTVAIMGAVGTPGLFAPEQCSTVARALAWAGGPGPQADLAHAYLMRDTQTISLDLRSMGSGGEGDAGDQELQANDILVVPALTPELLAAQQLAHSVLVIGAVGNPGMLPYTQADTAGKAIVVAGGAIEGADLSSAYVLRDGARHNVDLRTIIDGTSDDFALRRGEVLVVPSASRETVFVAGAVQRPGPIARDHAHSAAQALEMAGGPIGAGLLENAYVLRKGQRIPVDFLQRGGAQSATEFTLTANDLLFVPTGLAEPVYVAGAVRIPGVVPLHQADTAMAALTMVGGATEMAELDGAYILRDGERIPVDLSGVSAGEAGDVAMMRADILMVPIGSPEPIYVIGSVVAPGPQQASRAGTAAKALMMAGGALEDVSDLKSAYILRKSERIPVDLDAVVNQGDTGADVALRADDALVIPKREHEYHVVGEVKGPGVYTLAQADTVLTAVALAGGPLPSADLSASTLLRDGRSVPLDLDALIEHRAYEGNVELEGGDTIVIPRKNERVFVFGHVGKPGAYPFSEQETHMDLIAKAGGPSPGARVAQIWIVRASQAGDGDGARQAGASRSALPAAAIGSPPGPSIRDSFGMRWTEQLGKRKTKTRRPAIPARAQAAPQQSARQLYSIMDLAKLDPDSSMAQPRDGDMIYVPGPKTQKQDLLQWLLSLGTGALLRGL